MRSPENDIVSDKKVIIETHLAARLYYNYSEKTLENTSIRVHYKTETMSKITVTSMN